MKQIRHPAPEGSQNPQGPLPAARRLVILLPGAFSRAEDFETEGFIAALAEFAPGVDALAVDALPAYFSDPAVRAELAAVVNVERRAGYQEITLAGISLGGLGALLHDMEHGARAPVDRLIALAPYVGTREALAEVRAAGGLAAWRPGPACAGWERSLLLGLQARAAAVRSAHATPLVMAWGETDRFAPAIRTVAEAVPAGQRLVLPGGHDWPTWRRLWRELLSQACLSPGAP